MIHFGQGFDAEIFLRVAVACVQLELIEHVEGLTVGFFRSFRPSRSPDLSGQFFFFLRRLGFDLAQSDFFTEGAVLDQAF